jgi:hypothetical protein
MLVPAGSTATLMGASLFVPTSLPILIAAVLVIGALLCLVLLALRRKDDVRTELRVRPWSITFSLDARNGNRRPPVSSDGEPAPKDSEPASKP